MVKLELTIACDSMTYIVDLSDDGLHPEDWKVFNNFIDES